MNNRSQAIIQQLFEYYKYSDLRDRKIPLEPEERQEAMDRGCVWHFNGPDKPVCAIWKAKTKSGDIVFGSSTHRAMSVKKTLKGAIGAFPFIRSTS